MRPLGSSCAAEKPYSFYGRVAISQFYFTIVALCNTAILKFQAKPIQNWMFRNKNFEIVYQYYSDDSL